MKLTRLTDRIWVYPYEEERDRPNLGYIRGDRWSLAVDAGHSAAHTAEFYKALEDAGLPLPSLTVLTHWYWDHTFGMHAVHGLCLANARTDEHLRNIRERIEREGTGFFLETDESIRKEYADGKPVIVTLPDLVYNGEMQLDPGGCPIRVFQADAPHTDDSTLIFAENEKALFFGDAGCGSFPDWKKDQKLSKLLADTIAATGAEICLEGHWIPQTLQETLNDLLTGEG